MLSKNRLFLSLIGMLVLALILMTGCSSESNKESDEKTVSENTEEKETATEETTADAPRSIQHELGVTEIIGTPQRVVVLEFSFVDALAALGVSPVGIADDDNPNIIIAPVAEKIGDYTSVGTRKQPNLEVLTSLQPDLIIADLQRHQAIYNDLQKIAPTIVLESLSANYSQIIESFPIIADAVGKSEEGMQIVEDHKAEIEKLSELIPDGETQTVLPAVVTVDSFSAHPSSAYTGSLLESVGLTNAIQGGDGSYPKLNLEQLVEINPDILFLMASEENTIIDEWEKSPLYQEISAVKKNQVYLVDRDVWSKFRGLISSETIIKEAVKNVYEK